jgi:hypothetical protein
MAVVLPPIPGTCGLCDSRVYITDVVLSAVEPGLVFGVCSCCEAIIHGALLPRHERRLLSMGATSLDGEIAQFLATAEAV